MRLPLIFISLALLVGQAVEVPAAESLRVPLTGEWDFTYTGTSTASIPELPLSSAFDCKVHVPGRWDDQLDRFKHAKWWPNAVFRTAQGPIQYLSGIGWHRKVIDAPSEWADRVVTLTVGHAVGTTNVWLNGKHVGSYAYGVYTPYEVDLTGKFSSGKKNELIIAVDNVRTTVGGWSFLGNAGVASGLARPVTLQVAAGDGRIADLYVRPGLDLKEVVWQAELARPTSDQAAPATTLHWSVRDAKSGQVLGNGKVNVPSFTEKQSVTWKAPVAGIKSWSDREPNLYVTELRWVSNDKQSLDQREQRFGLRRWSYKGRKLFLNDQPLYLRQEFGAYYFPLSGSVSTSKSYWIEHMRRLKQLGFNSINFAAQVCPIEMMEAADELGVILQCGDHATVRREMSPQFRDVWTPIVRTTRQHPSIAIYGFGGELNYYEGVIDQYQAQSDLIKSLHPESLVMPQQAIRGIDYFIEDESDPGVKKEPFVHHAERLARYTKTCDLFGHFSDAAFSYTYFSLPWHEMEKHFQIYDKPLVAHELFLSASYLNPENAAKYTGRIPPYIYSRLESDLKAAGALSKWSTYFDHTSRLQHICRKYCMEKVRKCDGLAGFELLGMMDMHYITPEYTVGIVDEFLQMKPGDTDEGVRRYSNESVLLLDFDRGNSLNRCYWHSEPFTADILASLYGTTVLKNGVLKWVLRDADKVYLAGEATVDSANGCVSMLKKLDFTWPAVEKTTRVNLSVTLNDPNYSLANDWDFWVFPKHAAPQIAAAADKDTLRLLKAHYDSITPISADSKEKLRIVSKLNSDDIQHLEEGGDVVLLGTEPFTAYTRWPLFYPALGVRPHSNGGTIIAKHAIFDGHPNDGWNDWLFMPLMERANCILFDGKIDMPFDPIMEIISSSGHVRKQAMIFENRVGRGRLLVVTAVFDMKNASCVTLMDNILKYVASKQFDPQHRINAAELNRLHSPEIGGNKLPDPGFEKSGYWVSEGGKYELDESSKHTGRKSLKLVVTEDDLRQNRNYSSSISARRITWDKLPLAIKLSAWMKSDIPGHSQGPRVKANLVYADGNVVSYDISAESESDEWQYVERTIDLADNVGWADVYIDLTGAAGTGWVDDVYFGDAESASNADTDNKEPRRVVAESGPAWQNSAFERKFDSEVWFRVGNNEWQHGNSVAVDQEGKHIVWIKKSEDDHSPIAQKVNVDLTPPVITLEMDPLPEQIAGVFTAAPDTRYSFRAEDALSGVDTIEVAIDGEKYAPYEQPFKLPLGKHAVRCRATDRAGNVSSALTGEWITGSGESLFEVTVKKRQTTGN